MHLALNNATRLFTRTQGIIIACFIILLLTIPIAYLVSNLIDAHGNLETDWMCETNWVGIVEHLDQSCKKFIPNTPDTDLPGVISTLSLFHESIMFLVAIVILLSGAMVTWFFIKGRKMEKDFRNINAKFIRQAYYFALQTAVHKNKNITNEFLEICEDIFPELKERHQFIIAKKRKKWFEVKKKIEDTIADIFVETKEGNFFVVTSEKTCSYEKIEKTLKNIKSKFKNEEIFRVIFLAKDYDKIFFDQEFLDKEFEKIDKLNDYNISFDLIVFTENSFNFLKLA